MARKTPVAPTQAPKPTPAPTPARPAPDPAPAAEPEGAQLPAEPDAENIEQPTSTGSFGAEQPLIDAPAAHAPRDDQQVPELDNFIAAHEKAAQAVDLVVTAISHPAAKPGHHHGVYSGFPIENGPPRATYSDGSTH